MSQLCKMQKGMEIRRNMIIALEHKTRILLEKNRQKKRVKIPVIKPDSYKYMIWDVIKSILYMMSIYTLFFLAALGFDGRFEILQKFDFIVDCIQMLDIVLTFFTAKRVQDMKESTNEWRDKQLQAKKLVVLGTEEEKELFIHKKEGWVTEIKYLAYEYVTSFFIFDIMSVFPALISRTTNTTPVLQLFKFFRAFRLGRIAN